MPRRLPKMDNMLYKIKKLVCPHPSSLEHVQQTDHIFTLSTFFCICSQIRVLCVYIHK